MQLLQECCHMMVFGLSKNKFCSVVLDSKREICFKGNPARMESQ